MTSSEVIALVAVVSSGIVGVASIAAALLSSHLQRSHDLKRMAREQEERYRVGLYAKRLEVHQQAHHWIYRLNTALNLSRPGESGASENETLLGMAKEAREWLDAHSLYLDPKSRSELVYFFNLCFAYLRPNLPSNVNIWQQMDISEKAIVAGIGMRHVEERKVEPLE